jgi:hypothetical protein
MTNGQTYSGLTSQLVFSPVHPVFIRILLNRFEVGEDANEVVEVDHVLSILSSALKNLFVFVADGRA